MEIIKSNININIILINTIIMYNNINNTSIYLYKMYNNRLTYVLYDVILNSQQSAKLFGKGFYRRTGNNKLEGYLGGAK